MTGVDFIQGNFDFLKENYPKLFVLADKMEGTVCYDPESSINTGNKFFEALVKLIYKLENLEFNSWNMKNNVYRLKDYNVYDSSTKRIFNNARKTRNVEIHSDELSDEKQAFKLCALLFQCASWFYNKYSGNKVKNPNFSKTILIKKNIKQNKLQIDETEIELIVERIIGEKFPGTIINPEVVEESVEGRDTKQDLDEDEIISEFSLKQDNHGSYLLNELSKLKKSSKKSVDGFTGFNNKIERYMHVNRGIEEDFKNKLLELSNKNTPQLIFIIGSVGDGKSHLLSYMNDDIERKKLLNSYFIHGDASESFAPNINEIRTLESILDIFADENYNKSDSINNSKYNSSDKPNSVVAINLGTLSNFIEDEQVKSRFSNLINLINDLNIFEADNLNYIATSDFLTIVNFSDYQLFELNDGFVSSKFISSLINKITSNSNDNSFYWAYKLDLRNNFKSPIIYNYEMLMSDEVKEIIIQNLIKYNIKNKKQISTRNILNCIYEILVPSEVKEYNIKNIHEYIGDLLPVLLFNSSNRSTILEQFHLDFSKNIRNNKIDDFIISVNTESIINVLDQYFDNSSKFSFFRNYFLSENYQLLEPKEKSQVLSYLVYFAMFFGKEHIKNAFNDECYEKFIKYLYATNYYPEKLKDLFKMMEIAVFKWKGFLKKDYIIIDDLPQFKISKEMGIMFKPTNSIDSPSLNIFRKEIVFHVFSGEEYCGDDCSNCPNEAMKCIKLYMDYLLFEQIMKMNEGYKPNKFEKENLILFDDFVSELISKSNENQVLIYYKEGDAEFKFKKLTNQMYKLRRG